MSTQPQQDPVVHAAKLNDLVKVFQEQLNIGAEPAACEARLLETAVSIHQAILAAIGDGYTVLAHKGSRRVLTMGSISPIRRTRFRYCRAAEVSAEIFDDGEFDECDIVAISRFDVALRI